MIHLKWPLRGYDLSRSLGVWGAKRWSEVTEEKCVCGCATVSTGLNLYSMCMRENVRALEKNEYPFNIHSRLPLSDLAVKILFLSLLVFIAIMSQ